MIIVKKIVTMEIPYSIAELRRRPIGEKIAVKLKGRGMGKWSITEKSVFAILEEITGNEKTSFYNLTTGEEIIIFDSKWQETFGFMIDKYESLENEVAEYSVLNQSMMLTINKIRKMGVFDRLVFLFSNKIKI